ncbi:ankyrin repeat-containing domain protein [Trichophaea hybrida]|nr:ankyrin repeat-containing domain protein [Trichophaea hybrida]
MHAMRNSPVEILDVVLSTCPEQLNTHCGDTSPIQWAIENEKQKKFNFLIDHGAAIERVCDEGNGSTLLHHCAYSMNHGEFFAAAIIDRGADIHAVSAMGYTPVREALCNGNIDLAKSLICKGGSLSDFDSNGFTTLGSILMTCSAASLAGVEFLLETSSPNYLVHPQRGLGALHFGICLADKLHDSSIHRQIYDLLLARFKSNLDDVDICGWSPLHFAAAFADPYALRMLLKAGANSSLRDGHGYAPLDIARKTTRLEPSVYWVPGFKLERIEFIQRLVTRKEQDASPSISALRTDLGDAIESEWGLEKFSEKRSTTIEFLAEWIEKAGRN